MIGYGIPERCGVTDCYFIQCILPYGHEGLHQMPRVTIAEEEEASAQTELFA